MFLRSSVFLLLLIGGAFAADLITLVGPTCADEECRWCKDCKCEEVRESFYLATGNASEAHAYMHKVASNISHAESERSVLDELFVSAHAHVEHAAKAMAHSHSYAYAASQALATAFSTSICAVVPVNLLENYFGNKFKNKLPDLSMCNECHKAFANASASAHASATAAASATTSASASARAIASAQASAHAVATAFMEAYAEAAAAAAAGALANAHARATARAGIWIDCDGIHWYADLTANVTTSAKAFAIAAAYAASNAIAETSVYIKLAVKAVAEAEVHAEASASAATLAVAEAETTAAAVVHALNICNGKLGWADEAGKLINPGKMSWNGNTKKLPSMN